MINQLRSKRIYKGLGTGLIKWMLILCAAMHCVACGSSSQKLNTDQVVQSNSNTTEQDRFQVPYKAKTILKFPQYTVLSKYQGEQELGVKYYSPSEREKLKVMVKDGLLYNGEGEILDPQLDIAEHSTRSGKAIFVISVDGLFWVCFDQRYGLIHHSSLLAAAPVLSAGEMVIEQGQLLSISNASGHYKPLAKSLDIALSLLKEMKVDLSQVERYEIGPAGTSIKKSITP